jgi:hypothetical protein
MRFDTVRALRDMRHRNRDKLFGFFRQGSFLKDHLAEIAPGIEYLRSKRCLLLICFFCRQGEDLFIFHTKSFPLGIYFVVLFFLEMLFNTKRGLDLRVSFYF